MMEHAVPDTHVAAWPRPSCACGTCGVNQRMEAIFLKKTAEVERQTQYLSRLVNFHVFSTVKSLKTALCYPLQY